MEKWELAYQDYLNKMKYKDIAEKYGVSINTVKSWKSRKWNAPPEKKGAHKTEKVAHKEEVWPVIDNDELTEAQKMFCLHYLQHFNATKAYMQVYQCDYRTANVNSSRMLVNASIKKELHRLKAELQQDVFIGVGDIVRNYAKQAVADITDYVAFGRKEVRNKHGDVKKVNYLDFKDSGSVDGAVIKNVSMGKDGPVVELYDKQKAMSELMKYLAGDDSPGEIENDGFIEALESGGEALWPEGE